MRTLALAMTDQDDRTDAIRSIADFMHGYSVEATRPSADDIAGLGGTVQKGTCVYVSAVPTQRADETIEQAARLRRGGYEPVPHIAVRAFANDGELDRLLARLTAEAAVRQVEDNVRRMRGEVK